ncbi:MAG: PHP domain-containing protein [Syntrophomonas sp.]
MKFYGDYHIHSHNSDGRQNHREIIEAARRKGLQEIAITDHGPLAAVIGVKNPKRYEQLGEKIEDGDRQGIKVYVGAEANIRGLDGKLDLDQEVIDSLDVLIAGMHPYTMPSSLKDGARLFLQNSLRHLGKSQRRQALINNTEACVAAIYANPRLDILSHPGLFFAIDVTEVARACVQKEVLFEINCGHEHPGFSDIMEANRIGVNFIVNSDAHFPDTVGELAYGKRAIEMLGIDPERVVNLDGRGGLNKWGKKARVCTYL